MSRFVEPLPKAMSENCPSNVGTPAQTYRVYLTEDQIKLVRQVISEKAFFIRAHPLPEDGDLHQRLLELDKPFHEVSSIYF